MKAVVMAGGEGSRLRPLTANRPKPLVPVCNRPIMEHVVRLLARHGCTEIVATLHYLAHEIQAHFGDGSDWGVRMHYTLEDTPLGTAGSVKMAQSILAGAPFFILSGDALTDCDLSAAYRMHREREAKVTIVLKRVPNPLDFGVVVTDEDGRIERFVEKPTWSQVISDTVNTGIYIVEPDVLDRIVEGETADWSRDVFPRLLADGAPLYGHIMSGYWTDVGTLAQYREAQEHGLSGQVELVMEGRELSPGIWTGEHTQIDPNAVLVPPVLLGRNCKVKAGARVGPYTVLGDNALIEEGATVERSVLWESAYVGAGATIQSAICGSRVTLKKDAFVHEDAVIGDRCLLDVGATIRPRVKIWPEKVIERGSTVTMSLIWGNKWRGSLFRELGIAGLSNIEITPDFATRLGAAYGSLLPPRSHVVTSRDSTRSSRMIKRAMIAALLGVGCDVLDLRSTPVPIVRHFVRASGAAGAVHVRKLPGNTRVTLLEFFDAQGATISRDVERRLETIFQREDFNRTDPDDLGMLEYASRAVENYVDAFHRHLPAVESVRRLRVVSDYGYSALAGILPAIMARYAVETISLNAVSDAKLAPRSPEQVDRHIANIRDIVAKLGYDMGVLFAEDGERLAIVDDSGERLAGNRLLATFAALVLRTQPGARIGLPLTAPLRLRQAIEAWGGEVVLAQADARSLMTTGLEQGVDFAGDERGGFMFPSFHPGFDALFSFAKLATMLHQQGVPLTQVVAQIPDVRTARASVRCPVERKGAAMRALNDHVEAAPESLDDEGLRYRDAEGWVLVLPDELEPLLHVHVEADDPESNDALLEATVARLAALVGDGE